MARIVRRASPRCVALIQAFEGIPDGDPTTVLIDAYLDPSGWATIGWGHLIIDPVTQRALRGSAGLKRARQVYPLGLSVADCVALLYGDLRQVEIGVNALVNVRIAQHRFDALTSFGFNVGLDEDADSIAEGLGDSQLLRYVNVCKWREAADQFKLWVHDHTGKVLPGLVRRREAERALFVGS